MSLRFHDMFCGAGWSTLGAYMAGATPVVGLNHWPVACTSYEANHAHAGAQAACVDVVTQDPRRYPPADILLASPECTHHSYARGRPKNDPSLFDPDGDQGAERSRAAIDWTLTAPAIADRRAHGLQELKPNTLARIRRGLPRLLERPATVELPNGLVVQVGGNTAERPGETRARSTDLPTVALTTRPDRALVVPTTHDDTSQRTRGEDEILPTLTGRQELGLVLSNMTNNVPRRAADEAASTITSGGKLALIYAGRDSSVPKPADSTPTPKMTAINSLYVVDADQALVVEQRGNPERPGGGNEARIPGDEAIGTISAQGNHHALVIANYGGRDGEPAKQGWARHTDDDPLGAITATDSHALFVFRNGQGVARRPDEPVPTIATVEQHAMVGSITEDDVMACTFRMLQPHELKVAGGASVDYILHGTKRDQVAQIGNAVSPPAEAELVRRAIASLEPAGA